MGKMPELERFNPYDPKRSLTFPRNDSIKREGQGLEILLVSADRAGSPIGMLSWMPGLFLGGTMATCKYCGESGWFLSLTDTGVCDNCAQILEPQVNRAVDIVMESVEIVNTSKNLATKLSRCETIEEIINKILRPLEEKGIETLEGGKTPTEVLAYVRDFRDKIVLGSLKDALGEAETKAETAKTPKAKVNAYSKTLQKIAELKDKVSNPSVIADVESLEATAMKGFLIKCLSDGEPLRSETPNRSEGFEALEVTGVSYHRKALQHLSFAPGNSLSLVPEPENPYDPNAVAVYNQDRSLHIGYVPKERAEEISKELNAGQRIGCFSLWETVKKKKRVALCMLLVYEATSVRLSSGEKI